MTGPVFNTQLGILFWAATGALFGAVIGPETARNEWMEIEASNA
jgi:hypothetical protein